MEAIKTINFAKYYKKFKEILLDIKEDPALGAKIRMIVMGYMIGFSALYGAYTVAIEPLQKKYEKRNKEYLAKKSQTPSEKIDSSLPAKLINLKKQSDKLKTQIEITNLQNSLLKEKWKNIGDEQIFFQVVLSLLPTSPTSLDQGMAQMSQLTPGEQNGFKTFPVNIVGNTTYTELLNYFKYLESKPEVGVFDKFAITSSSESKQDSDLNFSIQVGRIQYKE